MKTSLSIKDYTYLRLRLLKESCFSDFHPNPRPRRSFLYKIMLTAKCLKKLEEALERELGKIKDAYLSFSREEKPLCNTLFFTIYPRKIQRV